MCKNANELISNLMVVERPTLQAILTDAGVPAATQANVFAAYDAAQVAAANWVPGDTTSTALQLLNTALSVVSALKNIIPATYLSLLTVVIGGIEGVIGIINANNQVKGSAAQSAAKAEAIEKVKVHVPDFELSTFDEAKAHLGDTHVAANHYKKAWDKAADSSGHVELKKAYDKR